MILQAGMTFKSISMPPEDAQMLENRQFSVEEICRWFNVPPHKVQHLLRATFSNIEHQQLSFSTDTIRPWLVRWEQELKRKLFVGDDEHYAEHVMDAMLRGDSVSRAESNMRQFSNGALTINEWRRMENRPSLDDPVGDMHFVPVNLMPAEKLTAAPAQPPAPPAPPPQRSIDEVIQRYRPILEQVVTSLGRLESDRMTRAAKRPEAENAIAAFRASHHDHAVAVLRTVTTLIATDMGRSDVDAILQEITTRHIARIKPGEIDGVAEASLIALDIVEYMNHASS
ncbi:MAG TPA: phage portal protein [Anaerolineae bacterium]